MVAGEATTVAGAATTDITADSTRLRTANRIRLNQEPERKFRLFSLTRNNYIPLPAVSSNLLLGRARTPLRAGRSWP